MKIRSRKSTSAIQRNTRQREAIMEFLRGNVSHPSAEDIYRVVHDRFPSLSLATVYNTLETLKDAGEVQELEIDSERRRYDPCVRPHHHVICVRCRKVVDIDMEFDVDVPEEKAQGFNILHRSVQFLGVCSVCGSAAR